jgi:hypothetical protein
MPPIGPLQGARTFIVFLYGPGATDLELICGLLDIARQPRNLPGFGTAMKHQSRTDHANPYSPLMCSLVLLMVFAAIQLKIFAVF